MAHTASSSEDMQLLLQRELAMIEDILRQISADDLNRLLERFGYTLAIIRRTDVLHPIDGYNLIKRTARMWGNITEAEDAIRHIIVDR